MDNLASHKTEAVRETIEAAGAELRFLPPYSPHFNPIENASAKLEALLRKVAARTCDALRSAIADVPAWSEAAGLLLRPEGMAGAGALKSLMVAPLPTSCTLSIQTNSKGLSMRR